MAARFDKLESVVEGCFVRVRFLQDHPRVIGWQIYDPETGTFLWEGDWREFPAVVDMKIPLPAERGQYRIHVAPVEDRSRFVVIDAEVAGGGVTEARQRITSGRALRRESLLRAIPKAFVIPVRSFLRNRRLIASMVLRDIAARYRGSIGGALWTVLNPVLLMTAYFFVFGIVLQARFPGDSSRSGFVLYFLAGMLPWLAFSEAVGRAPHIILEHRNFVKKLVFPLETLPANATLAALATEAFALVIFLIMLAFARGQIPMTAAWLPVVLVPQILLTLGVCWILAAAGVFVRDLGQAMGFILTLWFFLTPICYPESALPLWALGTLEANPILTLVRAYRTILLEGRPPDLWPLMILAACSAMLAVAGHAWFHKLRKSFVDVI